jgi:hypothetical protein
MSENKSLIMRSNRLLGAALVDKNLISVEQLEAATERLLECLDSGSTREACLLFILTGELQALTQEQLLEYLVEEMAMGLLDMEQIDMNDDLKLSLQTGPCWATWSVPFEKDDDITYIASAYCLSPAVRKYWEGEFDGPIVWYGATLESISQCIEKLELERAGLAAGHAAASS